MKAKQIILFVITFLGFFGLAQSSEAKVINITNTSGQPSCEQADVQRVINDTGTADGDTVFIPEGTCTWDSTVSINKSIIFSGSGVDNTVITRNSTNASVSFNTPANGYPKMTGFTFKDTGLGGNNGAIHISGTNKNWRLHGCKFDNMSSNDVIATYGDTAGVIDHNIFLIAGGSMGVTVTHGLWDGDKEGRGDKSWASPINLGGSRAIFIEDNNFTAPSGKHSWAVDGTKGGRYVFRHNALFNTSTAHHGTEGLNRGVVTFEVYNNFFDGDFSINNVFHSRSGTGVLFNNVVAIGSKYQWFMNIANHRNFENSAGFGACDGRSPYDINDIDANGVPKVFDSGISTNATFSYNRVDDSSKNWTTDQWKGYSVINTNTGMGGIILSNTNTTLNVFTEPDRINILFNISPGDNYIIMRALACMDQTGRGQSDLIVRPAGKNYSYAAWPNQPIEPVYAWNNTFKGTLLTDKTNPPAIKGTIHIIEGRDFFSNTSRSGYTPYTYPHPLTLGDDTTSPSAPTGVVIE